MAKVTEKYLDELAGFDGPTPNSKVLANLESQEQAASFLKDVLTVAGQGAAQGFGDEAIAALSTGSISSPEYKQKRGEVRETIRQARENVPFAPVVEAAGSVATTAAAPFMRAAPVAKEMISAGIQGAGEAGEVSDIPSTAAKSMLVQGAGEIAGKGLKTIIADDATKILSRSMGAKARDIAMPEGRAIQDRIKRLNSAGFFKQGEVAVDINNQTFKRSNKGLSDMFKPQNLDTLYERATNSLSTLKDANNKMVAGKKLPQGKLLQALDKAKAEMSYDPSGYNVSARIDIADEVSQTILDDLIQKGHLLPGKPITAQAIEEAKRALDMHIGSNAFKKRAEELGINPEAMTLFRGELDNLVDSLGGPAYKKNNDLMSDLMSVRDTIEDKLNRSYVDSGTRLVDARGWKDKLLDTVSPTPVDIVRSDLATMSEAPLAQTAGKILKRTPVESLIKGNYREPQSLEMTPMEIAKSKLPRTTKGLLENKELVLKKLALSGVPDDLIDTVAQALNDDPESVESLGAMVTMQFPTLFAKSKYNMFDGKILDPQQRAKAADDTSKRSDINSIERARIISELNKTGKYLGE